MGLLILCLFYREKRENLVLGKESKEKLRQKNSKRLSQRVDVRMTKVRTVTCRIQARKLRKKMGDGSSWDDTSLSG